MKKKLVMAIMAAALALTACGSSDDTSTDSASTSEETTQESDTEETEESTADTATFTDGVYSDGEMTITITDHKVIPVGETGNEYGEKPVIAFWYDVENISKEDLDPSTAWILTFKAIQDNDPNSVNELEVGSLPDEQYLDSQTEKIKIGGTVSNAIAYELDDDTTPVELVAQDILGTEYGRQEFAIQ